MKNYDFKIKEVYEGTVKAKSEEEALVRVSLEGVN